jgi:multidrug efflux pump subunit AcrB
MRLPDSSIRNFRFILVIVFIACIVGIYAINVMPRTEDPDLSLPNFAITALLPGTSPMDIEELIVKPIEDAIEELDDITEVITIIDEGIAIFQIEARFGIDYERKLDEIFREVNAIRNDLPENLLELTVEQFRPENQTSIMQLALVSETATYRELEQTAGLLERLISQIDGVKKTDTEALPDEEIRIAAYFDRMAAQQISLDMMLTALTDHNANIPGGNLKAGSRSLTVQSSGSLGSLDEIRRIPVAAGITHTVPIGSLANVYYAHEDIRWMGRFNGERAIFVTVKREPGKNMVQSTQEILQQLELFRTHMPADIALEVAFEQASAVDERISGFFRNLIQGMLLVSILIFIFLGIRSSFITITVIPIAMVIGIGLLYFAGFGLQQISIAALVIALGLLVDNGIVVVENITRYQKNGYGLVEASVKGSSEVGFAIISSTITTLLAFAPLAMIQSGPGEFLRSLPLTVIFVLVTSMLLALILIPILATRILKEKAEAKPGWFDRFIQIVIRRVYRPSLNTALRYKGMVFSAAIALFFISLMLFPFIGVSFFPTADKPLLLIEVDLPSGSNINETDRAVRFVESVLDTTAYVQAYTSNSGHGNPQIYYNRIPESYKSYHGQLLVRFEEWNPKRFYETLDQFRSAFRQYPGAKITFREFVNGAPFNAPIEIRVLGERLDQIAGLSFQVEDVIRSVEGTIDVENPLSRARTDLSIALNREKAALAGLSIASVDRNIRAAVSGIRAGEAVMEDGKEYPLVVRLGTDGDTQVRDLESVYLINPEGDYIPLRQVAETRFEPSINSFLHYNFERSSSVTANVINADFTTRITEEIINGLDEINWPDGYSYYVAGEYETQQEAFGDLANLLILAMIGVFAVLVLQFRSFLQPVIIFSAIPMAITGSFVALFITGWSFSFFAFVGFISLIGIVVNNSIILIDYANQLRREGKSVLRSVIESAETRFTPIVLTTTTTVAGLLPLTLSNTGLWTPLGWTIIGGMITSTALTLLIVPILYVWFTGKTT